MENLEDIKVGDKVVLYRKFQDRTVCKVERLTKYFIIVDGKKFRKKDGFEAGKDFCADYITLLTEDEIAKIEEENKRNTLIHNIRYFPLGKLSTDVLEKVYKLIKK